MMNASKTCDLLLASGASGTCLSEISGHDFDFDVVYPSKLTFSTSSPPTEPLPLSEIQNNITLPQITLRNPRNTSNDEQLLYISFAAITHFEAKYTAEWFWEHQLPAFAWIRVNQTVTENGVLVDGGTNGENVSEWSPWDLGESNNATLHVWQQTQNMTDYLFNSSIRGPLAFKIDRIWANLTKAGDYPEYYVGGYDFMRANLDFNVRNDTNIITTSDESTASGGNTAARPISSVAALVLCVIAALLRV